MADVVLINSPIILYQDAEDKNSFRWHGGDERSVYPLGVLYIAAYLEQKGHSVRVIDMAPEGKTLLDIYDILKTEKPYVVGISSLTTSIQSAVSLASAIKQKFGDAIHVGLGGVHLCVDPTFVDRFPVFDFGVIGDGEKTLEQILVQVKRGEKVRGIFHGETIKNLDELPFPARHLIDPKIYLREEQLKFEVSMAGVLGSRGCPYQCCFCCIPSIAGKVRMRSAKNIVDEMEAVYDQCRGNYNFIDDCLTLSKKHTLAFCQEIIDRRLKVRWLASTRANTIDDEVAKALKRAGCADIYFGVESGNERVRNEVIKKKVTDKDIAKAVYHCRKQGILTNLFLMVGFPGETKKEMMDTVKIGNRVKADIVGIHLTIPFPGSEIYKHCIEKNILPKDIIDQYALGKLGRGFRDVWPLFIPEGSSIEELITIKKKVYTSFYLNPFWMLRRMRTWFVIPGKFREDLKLFKIALYVFKTGGTKGQLS
ncbi:MAG: radical SAM protein [Candidatus Omnitrophota bacterium]